MTDSLTTRIPPYNENAECGILGSILLDSSRVLDLCLDGGIGDPDAFFTPANRTLYTAFQDMYRKGSAIDSVTVIEHLKSHNLLDEIGGVPYLENLIIKTPTAAHAEYYIKIVREKFLLRRMLNCVLDIEKECYETTDPVDTVISLAEQKVLSVADARKNSMTWQESINLTISTIQSILCGGRSGISTGYINLDSKMRGLRNGEMIVLAARPSMGKTSLAMNIAENLALGEARNRQPLEGGFKEYGGRVPVAMFSLEMSQESLTMRMLCARAKIQGFRLESGTCTPDVMKDFTRAADELSKALIYVDDTGGLDVSEVRARARRMKKAFGIGLIVIDYLQLMHCREYSKQNLQVEVSAISGQVKAMAKELNVPVIVLSQLSRAPDQRQGQKVGKPRLSDLRDSGAIEQDADVVMLLRRPCKYADDPLNGDKTLAIVDIAKHRNGPTGEVNLNFDDKFTEFTDREVMATQNGEDEPIPPEEDIPIPIPNP